MGGGRERFPLVVHIPSRRAVLNVQRFLSLELEFAFGGGGGKRKKKKSKQMCSPDMWKGDKTEQSPGDAAKFLSCSSTIPAERVPSHVFGML